MGKQTSAPTAKPKNNPRNKNEINIQHHYKTNTKRTHIQTNTKTKQTYTEIGKYKIL